MLVEHLPPTSAVARAYHGHSWLDADFMLAHIGDLVAVLAEITRAANSEDSHFRRPDPLPRPGDAERTKADAQQRARDITALQKTVAQLLPRG